MNQETIQQEQVYLQIIFKKNEQINQLLIENEALKRQLSSRSEEKE